MSFSNCFPPEHNTISIYLSHPITGKAQDFSKSNMTKMNSIAELFARDLYDMFGDYIDLYVPALQDEFIMWAFAEMMLSVDNILDIDCKILEQRDLLVAYNHEHELSHGMGIEIAHAMDKEVPVLTVDGVLTAGDLMSLQQMLAGLWVKKYPSVPTPKQFEVSV